MSRKIDNPLYWVFSNAEDAYAHRPEFQSEEGVRLREQAADARRKEQESFFRSDTDGFVSQWCNSIEAQDADSAAKLADSGNLAVFKVLLDCETNELVGHTIHIFKSKYHSGVDYKWSVRRTGSKKPQWVTNYKRHSNFAVKGLRVAWMLAPAKLYSRNPGNHLVEKKGLSGMASYHGKSVGIDYESAGLQF
jgi:hypothetical protein